MTEQDVVWLVGLTIVFIFYCITHNQYKKFEEKIKKDMQKDCEDIHGMKGVKRKKKKLRRL